MKRKSLPLIIVAFLLLTLGGGPAIGNAAGQQDLPAAADIRAINAAGQAFIAAIGNRDVEAMEELWAHEPYAVFVGPLSTAVVVGWEGVREAWRMRFGQFDRVTISQVDSHVHANGNVAWAVGVERIELLRKDGRTMSFDAFATNVFEKQNGRWLVVSHHSTPVFRPVQ